MRFVSILLISTAMTFPAVAQTAVKHAKPHHTMRHATGTPSGETVNDKGPYTPEANRAYNGGGLVTTSAPTGATPGAMSPAR